MRFGKSGVPYRNTRFLRKSFRGIFLPIYGSGSLLFDYIEGARHFRAYLLKIRRQNCLLRIDDYIHVRRKPA
jgi:hypothetical protein